MVCTLYVMYVFFLFSRLPVVIFTRLEEEEEEEDEDTDKAALKWLKPSHRERPQRGRGRGSLKLEVAVPTTLGREGEVGKEKEGSDSVTYTYEKDSIEGELMLFIARFISRKFAAVLSGPSIAQLVERWTVVVLTSIGRWFESGSKDMKSFFFLCLFIPCVLCPWLFTDLDKCISILCILHMHFFSTFMYFYFLVSIIQSK